MFFFANPVSSTRRMGKDKLLESELFKIEGLAVGTIQVMI